MIMVADEQYILKTLLELESCSKDYKTKVGCILVPTSGLKQPSTFIYGWNKAPFPDKMPMRDENGETYPYVLHAEEDCLTQTLPKLKYNMYVSYAPCLHCAGLILNSGKINKVYFKAFLNGRNEGIKLLEQYGIETEML